MVKLLLIKSSLRRHPVVFVNKKYITDKSNCHQNRGAWQGSIFVINPTDYFVCFLQINNKLYNLKFAAFASKIKVPSTREIWYC